jgi:hypothetical protein
MEAMGSAALVFVDNLYVPRPSIPLHNQHIVYYDNMDKAGFFGLLDTHRAGFARQSSVAAEIPLSKIAQSVLVNTNSVKSNKAETSGSQVHFLRGSTDVQRRRLWSNGTTPRQNQDKSSNSSSSSHLLHHPFNPSESHPDDDHPLPRQVAAGTGSLSESERIAYRGYVHSLRFLRTDALVDYIFRTLHILELENPTKETPHPSKIPTDKKEDALTRIARARKLFFTGVEDTPSPTSAASPPSSKRFAHMHFAQAQDEDIVTPREEVQEGNSTPKDKLSPQEESVPPSLASANRMKKHNKKDRGMKGFGGRMADAAMMNDFGFEIRSNRRLSDSVASWSGSLDAMARIDPSQRNYRVSHDRVYGSSPLYGYNAEHGFTMRWRAIPTNGNPTKPTGVVAPGSAKGSEEIVATIMA